MLKAFSIYNFSFLWWTQEGYACLEIKIGLRITSHIWSTHQHVVQWEFFVPCKHISLLRETKFLGKSEDLKFTPFLSLEELFSSGWWVSTGWLLPKSLRFAHKVTEAIIINKYVSRVHSCWNLNPYESIHCIHSSQCVVRTVISILHSLLLQTIFIIPCDTYYKYKKSKDLQLSLEHAV